MSLELVAVLIIFSALLLVGIGVLVARCYRQVEQGQALIINKMSGEPLVTFGGAVVYPIINKAEVMNISVKTIEIERRGQEGLICKDNIRADIKVTFFVRVNKTVEDVLKVAQAIGCERASDQNTLEALFVAKFSEALKTVGKRLEFEELYTQRDNFKDQIIEVIGRDLNGYVLEDAAIDFLEQTPLSKLDKENILDAQGIRKITEITTQQNVKTNDLRQTERKALGKQNLEADEAVMELEKRRADAAARQKREIDSIQSRESNEAARVKTEEEKKAKIAAVKADEELKLTEVARARQIEIAEKDRQRVIAIKSEQVEKDRQLEVLVREREVELNRIDKDKALEKERKEIADVVRGRIVVDRAVAEEEERIKTLRTNAEAERKKQVTIIAADAAATEKLVAQIKGAEASEKASEHKARERITLANAALDAATKESQAKVRLSEGMAAEAATPGIAEARGKEALAQAYEKQGLIEARVTREKMLAEAEGSEKKGLAELRVREAAISLEEREGAVKAGITTAIGNAESESLRARMFAEAAGREAGAVAIEKVALAEARGIQEKMRAEAVGLSEKLTAMKQMEGAARAHEEFRLTLEKDRAVQLATVDARIKMAEAQARILATAFEHAQIKIVGGESAFINQFTRAAAFGETVEGVMDQSPVVKQIVEGVMEGGPVSDTLKTASLAALLTRFIQGSEGPAKDKLEQLLDKARKLGVDTVTGGVDHVR
jgi:uncharacterized membrane protein YqiK